MREYNISKPTILYEHVSEGENRNYWEGERKEGKSTLTKWECGCGQVARVGTRAYFASCALCQEPFMPQADEVRTKFEEEIRVRIEKAKNPREVQIYTFFLEKLTLLTKQDEKPSETGEFSQSS